MSHDFRVLQQQGGHLIHPVRVPRWLSTLHLVQAGDLHRVTCGFSACFSPGSALSVSLSLPQCLEQGSFPSLLPSGSQPTEPLHVVLVTKVPSCTLSHFSNPTKPLHKRKQNCPEQLFHARNVWCVHPPTGGTQASPSPSGAVLPNGIRCVGDTMQSRTQKTAGILLMVYSSFYLSVSMTSRHLSSELQGSV